MEIGNLTMNVCRLCAQIMHPKSAIPLYAEDKQELVITKQINQLVANLVSPNDGLPQEICLQCSENVELCYSFVANMIETQNKLKCLVQTSKKQKPPESVIGDDQWTDVSVLENDKQSKSNYISGTSTFSKEKIEYQNYDRSSKKNDDDVVILAHTNHNQGVRQTKNLTSLPPSSQPTVPLQSQEVIKQETCARVYRCGICYEKFIHKNECLQHIVSLHPFIKKPISPSTIFESIKSKAPPRPKLSELVKNDENIPKHKRTRKCLALDSFYEVVKKNCRRYTCDNCGRLMTSWFAFKRHLSQHGEKSQPSADDSQNARRARLKAVNRPAVGYCAICEKLVRHFSRHKMLHAVMKLEINYPNVKLGLESVQKRYFVGNSENLSKNQEIQSEVDLAVVDDFIELLVVHPEGMVDMDINNMLTAQQQLVENTVKTVTLGDTEMTFDTDSITCMKEEDVENLGSIDNLENMDGIEVEETVGRQGNDVDIDEEEMLVKNELVKSVCRYSIKEEPTDASVFTIDYRMEVTDDVDENHIVALPEQEVDWIYNENDKDTTTNVYTKKKRKKTTMVVNDACSNIVYKCGTCSNTFETEKLFQSHVCNEIKTVQPSSRKIKNVFHCELCNRVFKSKLVYKLHASQHKKSNLCHICNACFLDAEDLLNHMNEAHPYATINENVYEEVIADSEKQCDVCGKITDNLKQHKIYHAIKELEYCKSENKKFMKKWFYCQKCNKKIFSEANYLFHVAKHEGEDTVSCRQCDFVANNIQDYNMHITTHTGGKYFICNDCEKCFFTRSAISDHVLIHMDGTRYMCEICGKRFKTSRSNAQHKLLQHKKYFRCNRCNRGFTHENKLKNHYNICRVLNQDQNQSKVFEPVEKFFCNICNSNIKSSSEVSILFHKAKHEGKDGVECRFCNLICKNACMYKNHLLIHTNQRPYACTQCPKSFRTKGCLVQHMLVHGDEYKYTCEYCGKKSKKLTTHVNHVNIHTDTKPYKCPDCDRPFRQLSDMKKHRKTHLKYKTDSSVAAAAAAAAAAVADLPYLNIKTEVEDMIAAESIQQLQLA